MGPATCDTVGVACDAVDVACDAVGVAFVLGVGGVMLCTVDDGVLVGV